MSGAAAEEELRELAEARHERPEEVLVRAKDFLDKSLDTAIVATAWWVTGLALHELSRPGEAIGAYRHAVALAAAADRADLEATARASLAISLLSTGDAGGAEAEMAAARAGAPPAVRGVVAMLGALLVQRTGRLDDALAAYRRAARLLEQAGDRRSLARLHLNRGILLAYRGQPERGLEDLAEAERLAGECRLPVLVAMAAHNTGFVHGRRGHLPDALRAFSRAERAYADLRHPGALAAVLEADRCEVLLLAGLVSEARRSAEAAMRSLETSGDVAYANECRLLLARAMLAAGAYLPAAEAAEAAALAFRRSRRPAWAALAGYVAIQAEVLRTQDAGLVPAGLLARCRRLAAELQSQGWSIESVHVRTYAGRLALSLRRPDLARADLAEALPARHRGTAERRAQAWHAAALLALAEDRRPAARRALSQGMQVLAGHLATLGAAELRARAASLGAELARTGIRLALEDRRPGEVLRWAETWRAASLRRPAVRPPDDADVAGELAELRGIRAELRDAALAGQSRRDLERLAVGLEESVRRRLREARDDTAATGRPDLAALRRALGPAVLVEYVDFEGTLHAVTMRGGRTRLHDLGPRVAAEAEQEYLLFALRRRLGRAGPVDDAVEDTTARRLQALLLDPLALDTGGPLVVVPTGALHACPWSALPGLAARAFTVAPSAAVWADGQGELATGPATLVAGPALAEAEAEVRRLARLYPSVRCLTGAAANAEAFVDALGNSSLVHVAAHGRFRSDSPLFSSILLDDGPLNVLDMTRAQGAPALVVLASCDAAVHAVAAGDEVLGTAATLLSLGVRWVVAPVVPVPDLSTRGFMIALHQALAAGVDPPAALAAARRRDHSGVGAAFVCIGRRGDEPASSSVAPLVSG